MLIDKSLHNITPKPTVYYSSEIWILNQKEFQTSEAAKISL
jgi:hypothetical protein